MSDGKDEKPGYRLIHRPFRTLKNGKRIYASAYGLKTFPMWVKDGDDKKKPKS